MSHSLGREQDLFLPLPEKHVSKKRLERRKSFNFSRSKLPALLVALLLAYMAISFGSQFGRLSVMQRDVRNIQQQVQDLQHKNAALREELRLIQSDAHIEKTAREKLGLVKQGETRVVPVPRGTQLKKVQAPAEDNAAAD